MDDKKRDALRDAGFVEGDIQELFGLTDEELAQVEELTRFMSPGGLRDRIAAAREDLRGIEQDLDRMVLQGLTLYIGVRSEVEEAADDLDHALEILDQAALRHS